MSEIREIILRWIKPEEARNLSVQLYEEVGRKTSNMSLSVTLAMLVGAFEDSKIERNGDV